MEKGSRDLDSMGNGLATPCTRIWVISMVLLGTIDVGLNVLNLVSFSFRHMDRGLITGEIPGSLWSALCAFTVFSVLLYVLETLNTLSVVHRQCDTTVIPLHHELIVTLSLEHVPLSAINYFIFKCQRFHLTHVQAFCGGARIVFVFVRIMWHARIQGTILKRDDTHSVHLPLFMTACILYASTMSFPIQTWRYYHAMVVREHHVTTTSIFLVNSSTIPEAWFDLLPEHELFTEHGPSLKDSRILASIRTVWKAGDNVTSVSLTCPNTTQQLRHFPPECSFFSPTKCPVRIQFKFVFQKPSLGYPYGAIHYNYAVVRDRAPPCRATECRASHGDLSQRWGLHYMKMDSSSGNTTLGSPNDWGCVPPRPVYDDVIDVCQ